MYRLKTLSTSLSRLRLRSAQWDVCCFAPQSHISAASRDVRLRSKAAYNPLRRAYSQASQRIREFLESIQDRLFQVEPRPRRKVGLLLFSALPGEKDDTYYSPVRRESSDSIFSVWNNSGLWFSPIHKLIDPVPTECMAYQIRNRGPPKRHPRRGTATHFSVDKQRALAVVSINDEQRPIRSGYDV